MGLEFVKGSPPPYECGDRARSDDTGPEQRLATAIMEICVRLICRENAPTIIWAPSHSGIEGNEWARCAVENVGGSAARDNPKVVVA